MKSYIILSFLIVILMGSNPVSCRKSSRISARFRDLICRKCWGVLYVHCKGGVRLSKRSIQDDTSKLTAINKKIQSSTDTHEQSYLSRVRREVHSRSKRRAYRQIRIKIKNCKVCKDLCFH